MLGARPGSVVLIFFYRHLFPAVQVQVLWRLLTVALKHLNGLSERSTTSLDAARFKCRSLLEDRLGKLRLPVTLRVVFPLDCVCLGQVLVYFP
jgi:hypothetical protein